MAGRIGVEAKRSEGRHKGRSRTVNPRGTEIPVRPAEQGNVNEYRSEEEKEEEEERSNGAGSDNDREGTS